MGGSSWQAQFDDIATALREVELSDGDLAGGAAGLALFFAYRHRATGEAQDGECAVRFLEAALDGSGTGADPSLFSGRIGVAWTLAHLAGEGLLDLGDDDPNDGMDAALLDFLDGPATADYDLISGLVGLGVYALERLPRPAAVTALERIVAALGDRARTDDAGLAWWTPPELLPDWQREQHPDGYWNLGVAHGVPGVIAFLGRVRAAGVVVAEVNALLDGAVPWLLAQQHLPGGSSCYSSWISAGDEAPPARTAWCYGDPGVAIALLAAGRPDDAVEIARHAAARPERETGVADGGLCHGAAGLALTFRRLAEHTGDEQLVAASRHWFARAAELPTSEPGFLEGSAGVGLALLTAVTGIDPAWDRVLLLSGPPGVSSPPKG